MAKYDIAATVSSPPLDVSLKVAGLPIRMARDGTGSWSGKNRLDLADLVPIDFRAVGIASAPWELEIKFVTVADKKTVKDYKHDDQIPNDLLSVFQDNIDLTAEAAK